MFSSFFGLLLSTLVVIINKSLRITFDNQSGRILFGTEPYIFAIWHKNTFTPFYAYRNKKIAMFVSTDFKGRILEKAATRLGYDAIPLERDSARSTVTMVHRLRDKQNILMAVDGPRGPREQVKDGSRYLTDKTDVPTIPVSVRYSTALPLFFRWDRYQGSVKVAS